MGISCNKLFRKACLFLMFFVCYLKLLQAYLSSFESLSPAAQQSNILAETPRQNDAPEAKDLVLSVATPQNHMWRPHVFKPRSPTCSCCVECGGQAEGLRRCCCVSWGRHPRSQHAQVLQDQSHSFSACKMRIMLLYISWGCVEDHVK